MKADLEFIKAMEKSSVFRHIKKIPAQDNTYEYGIQIFEEGMVFDTLYLENPIVDEMDNIIGFFAVNFEQKVLAYNVKKEPKR